MPLFKVIPVESRISEISDLIENSGLRFLNPVKIILGIYSQSKTSKVGMLIGPSINHISM